jgi:hypothetical protein
VVEGALLGGGAEGLHEGLEGHPVGGEGAVARALRGELIEGDGELDGVNVPRADVEGQRRGAIRGDAAQGEVEIAAADPGAHEEALDPARAALEVLLAQGAPPDDTRDMHPY